VNSTSARIAYHPMSPQAPVGSSDGS
jgi:hypothetical protein